MATALEMAAISALEACVSSEHGIIIRVETNSARDVSAPTLRAKQVLYRFRQQLNDPTYASIQIRLSPDDPDNELWLLKTEPAET